MYIEFYNRSCDVIQDCTESIIDAQHISGDLIDGGFGEDIKVFIYERKTDDHPQKEISLDEFIRSPFYSIFNDHPVNPDIYHNLDETEQREVLKFTPDDMIIQEITRRMNEYKKATSLIVDALDDMKIYV